MHIDATSKKSQPPVVPASQPIASKGEVASDRSKPNADQGIKTDFFSQVKAYVKEKGGISVLALTALIGPIAFAFGTPGPTKKVPGNPPTKISHIPGLLEPSSLFPGETEITHLAYPIGRQNTTDDTHTAQKGIVVTLIYRKQCAYCQRFIPKFNTLAQAYIGKKVRFRSIRFSDNFSEKAQQKEAIAPLIHLRTFPCLVITKDGTLVHLIQGNAEERKPEHLKARIDQLLQKVP